MPNHHPSEIADLRAQEVAKLNAELTEVRLQAAKMDRAITASVQLIEALIAWLPEGQVASSELGSAYGAWRLAMEDLRK